MTMRKKQPMEVSTSDSTNVADDVPPGYKRTEVGMIPVDWIIRPLKSCLRGNPEYGINAAAVPFDSSLPTYVRITDINDDNKFKPSPRVSVEHPDAASFFLRDGDLVFARTGASVGKSYLYRDKDGPLVFAGFLIRISTEPSMLLPAYLSYYVQTKRYWDWVRAMSIRSGQPGINGQEYGTLLLPLPPPPEQRAIAEALSDVDGLIDALGKLITKKRAIKQAAMQQLLTGKKRLPGFSGEWEAKTMGQVGLTYGGLSGKSKSDFGCGTSRYVTFLNVLENIVIDTNQLEYVKISPGESQNRVRQDDLLFNGTSETPGELAMGAVMESEIPDLYLNSFCFGFRIHNLKCYSPKFVAYYFKGNPGRQIMFALAQGATRYNMSKRQFLKLSVAIPGYAEQIAIVAVLSDMDAEIEALECRRDKIRAVKQGMMQQLLTGRVRLVKPEYKELNA